MAWFLKDTFIFKNKKLKNTYLTKDEKEGGSDEKMRRMWLEWEIVLAGLSEC